MDNNATNKFQRAKFTINYENRQAETFEVLFNPSQYVISKSARYSDTSTVDTQGSTTGNSGDDKNRNNVKNFIGTSDATLSLELFLDTTVPEYYDEKTEKPKDVKDMVDKFMSMCIATDGQHKPPKVQFCWGSQIFEGYAQSVSATYLLFSGDGKPLRARVSLSISESEPPGMKVKKAGESPDRTKARMIKDDVNIFHIAFKEFADPGRWKEICKANNIANPLDIPIGTVLKVPAEE